MLRVEWSHLLGEHPAVGPRTVTWHAVDAGGSGGLWRSKGCRCATSTSADAVGAALGAAGLLHQLCAQLRVVSEHLPVLCEMKYSLIF